MSETTNQDDSVENDLVQNRSVESPPSVAPTMRLSRLGLIISLSSMVAAGLAVYALFPSSIDGPPLPVEVQIGNEPVMTTSGVGAMVTEVVIVTNVSDHDIPKLTLDINGQYLLLQSSPLKVGETLTMPQSVFTDKRSSQRFDAFKYDVEDVTVTGQLPSGARGVSKFFFSE
ncbi:hypothetical protein [Rubripirellula reticaptiva]|uniref:Uncharacterized protein n=1 Tax=Rubripirellula reticaptiva TaxID=2528013 RepID=A0A5C6EQ74_9BACT|nr:hypothetical protein [Rubripirellula reticaptiva]TWU49746.1 hypothetical protein Poly59_43710 [Rubripirellula reticaptiva]